MVAPLVLYRGEKKTIDFNLLARLKRERSLAGAEPQTKTPATRKFDPRVFSFESTAIGRESKSHLQFYRFNISDESLVVVGEKRTDHVEHGVTEATDVHNVSSLTSLNRLVRLQIDAN